MRLINVKTRRLEEFHGEDIPRYCILSHTWGPDHEEISFLDMERGQIEERTSGKIKLDGCCKQAEEDGLDYAWIDTCCIDKANSTELSEAINSMFRWYLKAAICYAFLADMSGKDVMISRVEFRTSRWFTRGWTLQELLAPRRLFFYNKNWCKLGGKDTLAGTVSKITGIPRDFLLGFSELHTASVAQRMSWAAKRITKRKEDIAYSLLGIFDVTLPMIYGEEDKAFIRLQEEIIRKEKDDSILAWGLHPDSTHDRPQDNTINLFGNVLASSPDDFAHSGMITSLRNPTIEPGVVRGYLHVRLPLHTTEDGQTLGLLNCHSEDSSSSGAVVGIPLLCISTGAASDEYVRPAKSKAILVSGSDVGTPPRLIRIHGSLRLEDAPSHNRRYGFYIEQPFGTRLETVDVFPQDRWDKDNGVISIDMDLRHDNIEQVWVRLRQPTLGYRDFVVALECEIKKTRALARCHVMLASGDTTLEAIANAAPLATSLFGKESASNTSVSIEANLTQERSGSRLYVVTLTRLSEAPKDQVDADAELGILQRTTHLHELFTVDQQLGSQISELAQNVGRSRATLARMKARGVEQQEEGQSKEDKDLQTETSTQDLSRLEQELQDLSVRSTEIQSEAESEFSSIRELAASFGEKRAWQWQQSLILYLAKNLNATNQPAIESMPDLVQRVFMQALIGGYMAVIQILYKDLDNPDFEDGEGRGVLSTAVAGGNVLLLNWLLQQGIDANERDSRGLAPLSQAISEGSSSAVRTLLRHGANIETEDNQGRTPLAFAAQTNRTTVLEMLLDRKADIEGKSQNNIWPPLGLAAGRGHVDAVRLLLDRGADIEAANTRGRTPLLVAVRNGQLKILRLLLDRGASVAPKDFWGNTALALGSREGYRKITQQLLDHGADVEAKDQNGCTPLVLAVKNGHEEVTKLLLGRGADIESHDEENRTPLCLASQMGYETLAELLLDRGAKTDAKDGREETPLLSAITHGHQTIAELLLRRGADIESTDKGRRTPLALAVSLGKYQIANLLLDKGADVNSRDDSGSTALFTAIRISDGPMTRLLIDKGADLTARENDKKTPMFLAIELGNKTAVRLLLKKGLSVLRANSNEISAVEHARSYLGSASNAHDNAKRMAILHLLETSDQEEQRAKETRKIARELELMIKKEQKMNEPRRRQTMAQATFDTASVDSDDSARSNDSHVAVHRAKLGSQQKPETHAGLYGYPPRVIINGVDREPRHNKPPLPYPGVRVNDNRIPFDDGNYHPYPLSPKTDVRWSGGRPPPFF